jgi:hypothetical protein
VTARRAERRWRPLCATSSAGRAPVKEKRPPPCPGNGGGEAIAPGQRGIGGRRQSARGALCFSWLEWRWANRASRGRRASTSRLPGVELRQGGRCRCPHRSGGDALNARSAPSTMSRSRRIAAVAPAPRGCVSSRAISALSAVRTAFRAAA